MLHLILLACVDGPASDVDSGHGVEDVGHAPYPGFDVNDPPAPERPEFPDAEEDPALSAFLWEEGSIHTLALEIAPADMLTLESTPDVDVPATLTHEGERWVVGVRLKGNMTRRGFAGKPSLKIDVHQWRPNQRFHGLRRLTLNNMVQDKSMLKEHVAYRFYRELGVPAPLHGYARLTVNGTLYGLYGLVESMDQQFIDRHWGDDDEGNLYEGGYGGDVKDGREDDFAVQESGVPAPPGDLAALIATLEATPDAFIFPVLQAHFDIDALLRTLAFDLASGNWDAYARAANNFLLYHAPEADRWHLVPWGQDQAFTDRYVPIEAGWEGRLLVLCGRSPACVAALDVEVEHVLDVWESFDVYGYAAAAAVAIGPDCEADTRAEIPCKPDDLLSFLEERPGIVRGEQ